MERGVRAHCAHHARHWPCALPVHSRFGSYAFRFRGKCEPVDAERPCAHRVPFVVRGVHGRVLHFQPLDGDSVEERHRPCTTRHLGICLRSFRPRRMHPASRWRIGAYGGVGNRDDSDDGGDPVDARDHCADHCGDLDSRRRDDCHLRRLRTIGVSPGQALGGEWRHNHRQR